MDTDTITLDKLISDGELILSQIYKIEYPSNIICTFVDYEIPEYCKYERWKSLVIRFLSLNFPGDRCIKDFENAAIELKKQHNSPEIFERMIGILQSCILFPSLPQKEETKPIIDKSVNANVHQSQDQSQTQKQGFAIDIFLEAIKDEITGKQLKELKSIAQEESNPEKAKSKILNKVKSWGESISASIIANIITNPVIWNKLV